MNRVSSLEEPQAVHYSDKNSALFKTRLCTLQSAIYYFTKLERITSEVKFEHCTSLVPPYKKGGRTPMSSLLFLVGSRTYLSLGRPYLPFKRRNKTKHQQAGTGLSQAQP